MSFKTKEQARLYMRKWRAEHPNYAREHGNWGKDKRTWKEKYRNRRLSHLCLEAAHYCCSICGAENCKLNAHHIVPLRNGGPDTIDNLLCVCDKCHAKLHSGELEYKKGE